MTTASTRAGHVQDHVIRREHRPTRRCLRPSKLERPERTELIWRDIGESERHSPARFATRLAVVAVTMSLSGIVAAACGPGTSPAASTQPISLDAAVTATEHAQSFRFTIRSVHQYGQHTFGVLQSTGLVDETEHASESVISSSSGTQPTGPVQPAMQVITIGHEVWSRDIGSKPGTPSSPWSPMTTSVDPTLAADAGVDPGSFLSTLAALGGHPSYVGRVHMDGPTLFHYRVDVTQKLRMNQALNSQIRAKLGKSSRTVLDLWVDRTDVLRKITEVTSVVGGDPTVDRAFGTLFGGTITATFSDFGVATKINPPQP